jgi:hypothetical protein
MEFQTGTDTELRTESEAFPLNSGKNSVSVPKFLCPNSVSVPELQVAGLDCPCLLGGMAAEGGCVIRIVDAAAHFAVRTDDHRVGPKHVGRHGRDVFTPQAGERFVRVRGLIRQPPHTDIGSSLHGSNGGSQGEGFGSPGTGVKDNEYVDHWKTKL